MKIDDAALDERAATIALIVEQTDTDQRNVLYDKIATKLRQKNQHYSGKLFEAIAFYERGGK